jgi:hypothetical protein
VVIWVGKRGVNVGGLEDIEVLLRALEARFVVEALF